MKRKLTEEEFATLVKSGRFVLEIKRRWMPVNIAVWIFIIIGTPLVFGGFYTAGFVCALLALVTSIIDCYGSKHDAKKYLEKSEIFVEDIDNPLEMDIDDEDIIGKRSIERTGKALLITNATTEEHVLVPEVKTWKQLYGCEEEEKSVVTPSL